ncbi:MAG TPA: hypothetical protein G4N96_07315 [Chloroflexi bacterium]|nr:hypothetical protein [Chloroflexota bacterium]
MTKKPSISKTAKPVPAASDAPEMIITPPPASKTNGNTPADAASEAREALLQVDSYAEAESLLTTRPELIEQARAVFGAIVPTADQNEFMDLAIRAAAEDDPADLRAALASKRKKKLALTATEIEQLLEFADEQQSKSPALAFNVALLLSDDLTVLEDGDLWKKQKAILQATGKQLDIDPVALWEEISPPPTRKSPPKAPPSPIPVKVKAETSRPAPKTPPLPPAGHSKKQQGAPPRWLLAGGFIFLISMLSCGVCAVGNLF